MCVPAPVSVGVDIPEVPECHLLQQMNSWWGSQKQPQWTVIKKTPATSETNFLNYKKCFSAVLFAVCSANYEFTLDDIGEAGRQSSSGVYSSSNLGKVIDKNLLRFPEPAMINTYSVTENILVFIADEAFTLKSFMIQPYPIQDQGRS